MRDIKPEKSAKVMNKTFNKSAKDVAKFMKNTLKLVENSINSALKGAGYAASEVEGALSDAFNWAKIHPEPYAFNDL